MNKRYFQASEQLLDLISATVETAIKECWQDDPPVIDFDEKDGRMILTVLGARKATEYDPTGESDVYSVDFDLLCELEDYSRPYDDIGGPRGQSQIQDVRDRASALRKLATEISALADAADATANA